MAVPYELFLRFLATRGCDGHLEAGRALRKLGLPIVDQEDVDRQFTLIYDVLPKIAIDQIERQKPGKELALASKVLEIEHLWYFEKEALDGTMGSEFQTEARDWKKDMKLTYDVHSDRMLRLSMNALLIKGVSDSEIVRILSSKFSMLLKEKQVGLYTKLFFNPKVMTRRDWKKFLENSPQEERKIYFTALTEDVEALKTDLDLPAVYNTSASLQWLLTKSFRKAKQFIDIGTPEGAQEARAWIDKVAMLTDKYEKYRAGDQHDFSKALQMEFEFLEDDFGTPDDTIRQEVESRDKTKERPKEAKK